MKPAFHLIRAAGLLLAAAAPAHGAGTSDAAAHLSRAAVELAIEQDPAAAYLAGVAVADHSRWPERSPEALGRQQAREDALLQQAHALQRSIASPVAQRELGLLVERLEAAVELRACRHELWDVNHMSGWHIFVPHVALRQPVATPVERAQALARWRSFPAYVDGEIVNLRRGLAGGWSSPQSVVQRVVRQARQLAVVAGPPPALMSPGERSGDAAFKAAWTALVAESVLPAFERYAAFLETEYLPQARSTHAVSANPDGAACYQASLRRWTTLRRTPQQVHDLGLKTVERAVGEIRTMGAAVLGTGDLAAIKARLRSDPANRFASEDELVDFFRAHRRTRPAGNGPCRRSPPHSTAPGRAVACLHAQVGRQLAL